MWEMRAVKKHLAKASSQEKSNFYPSMNFQYYSEEELLLGLNKARRTVSMLQRSFEGSCKIVERVKEVLYHAAPVGEGSEIVLHFNHFKPSLSPCPGPSPTQNNCVSGPPRQLEGVPCRSRINKSAADVFWQQWSSPPDCTTSVLRPTANRGEQGAVRPLQGLNSGAMGEETPGRKECVH